VTILVGACARQRGTEEDWGAEERGLLLWMVGVLWIEVSVLIQGRQGRDVVSARKSRGASPQDE